MGLIAGRIRTRDWQTQNVDRLGDLSDVIRPLSYHTEMSGL